jgi:hypothetical protein
MQHATPNAPAMALLESAAAMGVMALCLELVKAGVLPAEAAQRVQDIMVDQIGG